ncbi:hypothetical protein ACFSFY_12735 [Sporosarcina siberiensis]|uniref:Uncharacterized protein n=1 Tax=Sporosarcina siberiensis TaxID=1365606 RepID=A0ABW4SJ73_9BACL
MRKLLIFMGLIIFIISGCSNPTIVDDQGLDVIGMQSGIGTIDDSEDFDKQKFSYDITLSNKAEMEVKRESVEIVLTDWIKQKQIENIITELTFDTESIIIKGHVNFDTKGLSKEEIVSHGPFIDGINVITKTGERIFIKTEFH